tara:strand:+ start:430 stop:609 length:180 start_codon:yes stop_codon:yes gene_type:complete
MAKKIKKRQLGRGLASLLGEEGEARGFKNETNSDIFSIPIEDIEASKIHLEKNLMMTKY